MNRASTAPSVYKRESNHPYNKSRSELDQNFVVRRHGSSIVDVHEYNEIFASEDNVAEMKVEQKMQAERNLLLKEL